jgi:putative mRNA 3-end processing factor
MNVTFMGGASEVGSLGIVLDMSGSRFLLDYGMTPTNPPKFPAEAPPVDAMFLSHSHIDHSGMTPWVTSHYDVPLLTSNPTFEVMELLVYDSLKISKYEKYMLPFKKSDVKRMYNVMEHVGPGDFLNFNDIELRFYSAGHIPGALMMEARGEQDVLFTGDINTIDTRLVKRNTPAKCDTLIMESTYAGRDHDFRLQIESEFLDKVDEVVDRGGLAIIPSFAVGRTQEMLLLLAKFDGEIWLDGMGEAVTRMYFNYPEYVSDIKKLKRAYRRARLIRNSADRKKALKGDVIITTSGMLDGGPVMEYLKWQKDDPDSAVILTGYQVEGTNGRMVMDSGMMNFYGVTEKINCEICFFDFSAHAGHKELVEFVRKCEPENLILCHGDNRELLKYEFEDEMNVHLPVEGKTITI